jgi:hypothetical protein
MTSQQYEELCRVFIADLFRMPVDKILTTEIANSSRPGVADYGHKIDLYWEVETAAARYVHIANAKWRRPEGSGTLEDVQVLEHIRGKIAAQKALLITNTGFHVGALAAAADLGIGLFIVRPEMAATRLLQPDRNVFRERLAEEKERSGGRALFSFEVVQKHFKLPLRSQALLAPPTGMNGVPGSGMTASTGGHSIKNGPGLGFRSK